MHGLLHTDVGKHRLDNTKPSAINAFTLLTIDLRFHLIDQVGGLAAHLKGEIASHRIRFLQTARSQRTGSTVFAAGMVDVIGAMTVDVPPRLTGQLFAMRTAVELLACIKDKVCGGELRLGVGSVSFLTKRSCSAKRGSRLRYWMSGM
jgi:hypothetical protein